LEYPWIFSGPQPFPLFERVVKTDEIKLHSYQEPRRIRFRYEEIEQVFMVLPRSVSRFTILFLSRDRR
jgi:hypothetical protein